MNGISFNGLYPNTTCLQLQDQGSRIKMDYPGFYFIYAKLNENFYATIYCGQSLDKIKKRLDDHYNKFNDNNHGWYQWRIKNKIEIKNIYFSAFNNSYGAAYENFIIYNKVCGITFNLNVTLNNHSDLLNINEINYLYQPDFGKFFISFYGNEFCAYLTNLTAYAIKQVLHYNNKEEIDKLEQEVKLLQIKYN